MQIIHHPVSFLSSIRSLKVSDANLYLFVAFIGFCFSS